MGVFLVDEVFDSGIFVAPKRIKTAHMSERMLVPQVVVPLNMRNGNPTFPDSISCVLLMFVFSTYILESE